MKDERINWRKINIVDYSGALMTKEAKIEYRKAFNIWCDCMHRGDFKKANYIIRRIRRIRKKSNYIEG